MTNTLFLRLEGPLQAWGERARWSVRDTAPEPTKSGVVGLLSCALGINEDGEMRDLSRRLRMGVYVERAGEMIRDYHTVVGGVLSAEGKIKINAATKKPETVVSWRQYLCDASFMVALQAEDGELIERLATAVQAPVWPVFLGRKACPPSWPIFAGLGEYPTLEMALEAKARQEGVKGAVRAVIECASGEGLRRREEIDSHAARTFLPRYTREALINRDRPGEVW